MKIANPTVVSKPIRLADLKSRPQMRVSKRTYRGDASAMLSTLANAKERYNPDKYGPDREEWHGIAGSDKVLRYDRAATLGLYGWTEAAEAAATMFRSVTTMATSTFLPQLQATDEPGDVDVAAYLGGSDLTFTSVAPSKLTTVGNGGIVTFEHDLFSSCGIEASDIVQRGVIVTAAIYALERAGVRCRVVGRLTARNGWDFGIDVKRADEPIHIGRLLFWLAHPSVLRLMLHSIQWDITNLVGFANLIPVPPPVVPGSIKTPGQTHGRQNARLDSWLATTLTQCGLTIR